MTPFGLVRPGEPLSVLCLGAHSDDIEIGAGGAILEWIGRGARLKVDWCVLSATGARAKEAEASANAFLEGAADVRLHLTGFEDGFFPDHAKAIKTWLLGLRAEVAPDIILTHTRDDAHQDHRKVNEITWNIFRDHLILEYEIPKWDGDLGRPNLYVPLSTATMERKLALLDRHFATQRSKDWFDAGTFRGLARLRGMECRAADGHAEAFHLRKGVI